MSRNSATVPVIEATGAVQVTCETTLIVPGTWLEWWGLWVAMEQEMTCCVPAPSVPGAVLVMVTTALRSISGADAAADVAGCRAIAAPIAAVKRAAANRRYGFMIPP